IPCRPLSPRGGTSSSSSAASPTSNHFHFLFVYDAPMKSRILFVDDEMAILLGLQRGLRKMRDEWDMDFVQSGDEALERLASTPYDVLVTDIRMPGMDGAELLARTEQRWPKMVRI